jgi:hypothetical protein
MKKLTMSAAALAASVLMAPVASAGVIFGFERITNNSSSNVGSQLTVEVSDEGANQVRFTFSNAGPLASSITDVYFDDGTLLGIATIINGGAGVDFSQGASPGNLPGGNAVNFNTSVGMSADSDPPVAPNGVNPGETLAIIFNLINGQTYADTLAAMALSLASPGVDVLGGLRIGLHIQALPDGESDAYVNTGPPRTQVPEPGSLVLLSAGLLALGASLRRRRLG